MSRSFMAGRTAFCVLVFAAVYPLVTGLAYLMQAAAGEWVIWQRHLVVVPIVVAMVFVIIPGIRRLTAGAARRTGGSEENMSTRAP